MSQTQQMHMNSARKTKSTEAAKNKNTFPAPSSRA